MLNSGKVARLAGVNKQTLRYYERIGLLAEAPRDEAGYRLYSDDTVARIRFIQGAKDLGFQLAEIQELLELRVDQRSNCAAVRSRAEQKRVQVKRKLRDLRRLDRVLGALINSCGARRITVGCPILAALEPKDDLTEKG